MFTVLIEQRAAYDIQESIDYYDEKQIGLGLKFKNAIDKEFIAMEQNPFYQIRYGNVRCRLVKKFPYLIHFNVNELNKCVSVFAVINTSKDPNTNWIK